MDAIHAGGCSLVGIALTLLMVRLFWMSSPPFNTMSKQKLSRVKLALCLSAVLSILVGGYYISQPVDESKIQRTADEGFQFH